MGFKFAEMSLRGVRQLKELVIRYSDYDGSSKGIRQYMSKHLIPLAEANPTLTISTERKRCAHPYLRGEYLNGNSKVICIKNLSEEAIHEYVLHLRNQIGRKVQYFKF